MTTLIEMLRRTTPRLAPVSGILLSAGGLLAGGCGSSDCETTRTCTPSDEVIGDGDGDALGGAGGMGGMSAILPRCPEGEISCEGTCVDPNTDVNFCGASGRCEGDSAGQSCADALLCESGICVAECDDGLISCDGECIDPLTDEEHCGATNLCHGRPDAGRTCEEGAECIAGQCSGWGSARPHQIQGGFTPSNTSPPFVGMDGDGNVILAFSTDSVLSMEFDAGLSLWNQPTLREQESGAALMRALVVAADGRAELLWQEELDGGSRQLWSTSHADAEWQPHFAQQASTFNGLAHVNVVRDRAGNTHSCWTQIGYLDGSLTCRSRMEGQAIWGPPVTVEDASGEELNMSGIFSAKMAALADDEMLVAFLRSVDGVQTIGAATKKAGGSWDLTLNLNLVGAGVSAQVLAAAGSPNGDAVVVWKAGSNLWTARNRDDAWSAPMALGTSTESVPVLKLVMDDSGFATAFWLSQAGNLVASQLPADEVEWSDTFTLTQDAAAVGEHDLSVDGYGNVTAVWLEEDDSVDSVWARRFTPDTGEWSHALVLERHSQPALHPRVTSNASGKTMVVWWIAGTSDMGYNRFW